jgi:hypothetical protein
LCRAGGARGSVELDGREVVRLEVGRQVARLGADDLALVDADDIARPVELERHGDVFGRPRVAALRAQAQADGQAEASAAPGRGPGRDGLRGDGRRQPLPDV